jgi:hypothetical protein
VDYADFNPERQGKAELPPDVTIEKRQVLCWCQRCQQHTRFAGDVWVLLATSYVELKIYGGTCCR